MLSYYTIVDVVSIQYNTMYTEELLLIISKLYNACTYIYTILISLLADSLTFSLDNHTGCFMCRISENHSST
jgi:hypothetical protein